jgi:cytoskeletal protein CcmA (bactofilin family)
VNPHAGSVIGASVLIKGQIHSREDLRLEGEVEGQVHVDGRLTVGQQGKVRANITAREVVMSGTVEGNIDASERIVLTKDSHLTGDAKTAGIVIEDGAYFKGGIDIVRPAQSASKAGTGAPAPPGDVGPVAPTVRAQSATGQ